MNPIDELKMWLATLDDSNVLIFADWLEERGDTRASLIRLNSEVGYVRGLFWEVANETLRITHPKHYLDDKTWMWQSVLLESLRRANDHTNATYLAEAGVGQFSRYMLPLAKRLVPTIGPTS